MIGYFSGKKSVRYTQIKIIPVYVSFNIDNINLMRESEKNNI